MWMGWCNREEVCFPVLLLLLTVNHRTLLMKNKSTLCCQLSAGQKRKVIVLPMLSEEGDE